MTDNEIIKALECCINDDCEDCPLYGENAPDVYGNCAQNTKRNALDLINRQKAEIETKDTEIDILIRKKEALRDEVAEKQAEIERLKNAYKQCAWERDVFSKDINAIKSEAYREFADKITEVFTRYAHIHQYAEEARRDYIEAVDGTNIEMQSVWDVFTLKKNGMAEYEEMGRLQNNIESISKERLLTELEKDFQLLVKELTRNLHGTCTDSK